MGSGLRTLGAATALAGLLALAPPGYADETPPPTPSLDQRYAGVPAGEGRARPGRPPDTLPYVPDESARPIADAFSSPPPPASPSPVPAAAVGNSPAHLSTPSDELRVHVLSMGAGLTLTGLGLAFLALRLRRS
ncbi:hypothetical protein [Streptomyces sp. cg36]|uniref:hypothetical protein n=1 Tax=Streptomyces sp. cg36 TaxID=3238798 RepID=UPI0034E2A762